MILGSNNRIVLNNGNLNTANPTNSLICNRGCNSYTVSRDGNILCGSCGLVIKSEEFEPEYYGGCGFDFQSNKRQDNMYGAGNSGINYENRQREINKQVGEFCTQYFLTNNEREEVASIVESMLRIMDEKKKKCRSLKSLVAACFYEYNKKLHKSIPINQMCKHFIIKQRKLLKYTKKLSKYEIQIKSGSITHSERIRNEWDEVMNTVTDKIKCFLITGHSQSQYSATYKPEVNPFVLPNQAGLNILGQQESNNQSLNPSSLTFKQQIKEIEQHQTQLKIDMIKQKIKALYNCEYLSVTRMGKHPTNYICTLMYVILKSMNIEFKNNKFCDQVGIKYSTLSREKKEIMQYLSNSLLISPPISTIPPRIQSVLNQLKQLSESSDSPVFNNKLSAEFIAFTLDHIINISSNINEEDEDLEEEQQLLSSSSPSDVPQSNYNNNLIINQDNSKNQTSIIPQMMIDTTSLEVNNHSNKTKNANLDDSFSFESCPSPSQEQQEDKKEEGGQEEIGQNGIRRQRQVKLLNQLTSSSSCCSSSSNSSSNHNASSPSSGSDEEDTIHHHQKQSAVILNQQLRSKHEKQ